MLSPSRNKVGGLIKGDRMLIIKESEHFSQEVVNLLNYNNYTNIDEVTIEKIKDAFENRNMHGQKEDYNTMFVEVKSMDDEK